MANPSVWRISGRAGGGRWLIVLLTIIGIVALAAFGLIHFGAIHLATAH